jgi:hypothetical protein
MPDLTAKRTLVKSPPELWEELSEVEGLMKHLGAFGEITITKLEPEHTVAWEGEHASGTVSIEPSGWGTKVTLHAELPDEPAPEPEEEVPTAEETAAEEEPPTAEEPRIAEPPPIAEEPAAEEPVAEQPVAEETVAEEPVAEDTVAEAPQPERKRRGFWGWLFRTRTAGPVSEVPPAETPHAEVPPAEEPPVEEPPGQDPPIEEPPIEEPAEDPPVEEPAADEPLVEEPEPVAEAAGVEASAVDPERARAILDEALDALGAAHHRPFSRG